MTICAQLFYIDIKHNRMKLIININQLLSVKCLFLFFLIFFHVMIIYLQHIQSILMSENSKIFRRAHYLLTIVFSCAYFNYLTQPIDKPHHLQLGLLLFLVSGLMSMKLTMFIHLHILPQMHHQNRCLNKFDHKMIKLYYYFY